MTKLTRKEVLHIARMSGIALHEHEIEPMIGHLEQVLSYAHRVNQVAVDAQEPSTKNINRVRKDEPIVQDPAPLLAQAPEREGDYFVVPKILDN